ARAIICQFSAFHSPEDARVAVVATPDLAGGWDWVKWLPHSQDDSRTDAAGAVRLIFDSLDTLEEALGDELSTRPRHSADAAPVSGAPHLLIVVDGGDPSPTSAL